MTLPAGLFGHRATTRRDLNVVVIPASREVIGMPETILGFGGVFADESGRRMAIVANRHGPVARVHPAAKLLLHDVTVHTGFSVVSHVRITTRIDKGEGTNTQRHTNCDTQNCSARKPSLHLCLLLWVAFDALEHRDVSQINGMSKRLISLVTSLAFPIRQATEINRMLNVD